MNATYEKAAYDVVNKRETLQQRLLDVSNWKVLVVDLEGELIGYCSLLEQFSTWDAALL